MHIDNRVPVVVIYRGGNGALAIARTLGRLGVPTYLVAQKDMASPVTSSRYWVKKFSWDFSAPSEATLRFLASIARELGTRPILLTLADWAAIFLEEHADALQQHFIFPRAASPIIRKLANKWDMFLLAKEHGIPTPDTVWPRSRADVERFAQSAEFPVIVKGADPFLPFGSKEIIHTRADLLAKYDKEAETGPANIILQQYIPGDAQSVWMCNAYFGTGSQCHAVFTGQKLRQVSDTGVASLAICLPNETVEKQTRDFMQAVGYQGAVGIGYRYDARDGKYKLLDVNARVSGVFRLFRATNGMDVVRICYLDLTGQPVPASKLTVGRKWMLEDDFEPALRAARAGKLTFGQWVESVRGVQETQWFALDDPMPFFAWFADKIWPRVLKKVRRTKERRVLLPG
jgi:D-aspartate ligase